jgi:hypothetical protein
VLDEKIILLTVGLEEVADRAVDERDTCSSPHRLITLGHVQDTVRNGFCGCSIQSVEAISIQFCHSEETPNKISAHNMGHSFGPFENVRIVVFIDDFHSGFFSANTTHEIPWAIRSDSSL